MLGIRTRTLKGPRRIKALWNANTDMERLIATHRGHFVNKWSHYYDIYDRHFARFRDRSITLLEIGIAGGGSLDLWRRYFGPGARLIGLDINPDCKRFESENTRIVIGDQGDPKFLETLAAETGPIDILIDDGSHIYEHQLASFRTLFPHIRDDGIYACEDLCYAYDPAHSGGVRKPGTYVEFLKTLIDEINAWYWNENVDAEADALAHCVHGMHFYASLVVIEKRQMQRPIVTPVGRSRGIERE
jgi:hypothetical protein